MRDCRLLRESSVLHSVISLFFSLVWTIFETPFHLIDTLNNIFVSKRLLGNFFTYTRQQAFIVAHLTIASDSHR